MNDVNQSASAEVSEHPARQRASGLRRTIRFAIATWVASALLVAIFALFWRMAYAPPHAIWGIVTTGAVVVAGTLTVLAGTRQMVRGPHRTMTAAIALLGTTPIVWFSTFMLFLSLASQYRNVPINRNVATLIAGYWAASIADVEAHWRYPRWTYGKHVVLLDDGHTPESSKLVAQMDEHIEAMAAQLHARPPGGHARWVRGSLLWLHGRALLTWAICDEDRNSPELTYTDRHELAHVTITMLGDIDQNPPRLLFEGWAEMQSKDRTDLILTLASKREQNQTHSLQELIGPNWYSRSPWAVYQHGGPLVIYLTEHYGPEKFLNLYHGVRQATFLTDCERILGDSWPLVEEHFWQWLDGEATALKPNRGEKQPRHHSAEDVEFADSVNRNDWQSIVAGYRAAWSQRPPVPKMCAFAVERRSTVPATDSPISASVNYVESTQCVIEDDQTWYLRSYYPKGSLHCVLCTPALTAAVWVEADGRVTRSQASRDVATVFESRDAFTNIGDLGRFLPLDPQRHYIPALRVDAIRRPTTPDNSLWEIDCVERWPEPGHEVTRHLKSDAAADWLVVSDRYEAQNERGEGRCTVGTMFGRAAVTDSFSLTEDKEGEWSSDLRVRELSPAEAQALREKVEAMARLSPTRDWYELLMRPLTLAIAWPAVGMLLAVPAILRQRREKNGAAAE